MKISSPKKVVLFLLLLLTNFTFSQGKIKKAKSELTTNQTEQTTSTKRSAKSDNNSYNPARSLIVDVTWGVFKVAFFGNYKNEDHLYNSLSAYPYYDEVAGNYIETDTVKRFRIDLQNQIMFANNNLIGNHLKASIRPSRYFYFTSNLYQLFENDVISNSKDKLTVFQFAFTYDRIRFQKFNLGWDLGINHIGNNVNETGILFGFHTDYFFNKNISVNAHANWGIINKLPVNTYSITGKYHYGRFTTSVGLEKLKIASPKFNFVVIGLGVYI